MSKAIKAIDEHSVHRICSGQVVLDLATAVKELVENSLDAGATTIDIRFKDHGIESLEVIDNGSGLEPSDYETLALKHYTSKISKFEDLMDVATFGFRGEALSSLCALANLWVTTSTASQTPTGYRLEYDSNGKLASKTSTARSPGMTVQLGNLFHSLPVRHREFKKNIKREFAKALNIIQSYAIISPNVRIVASNQIGKGASSKVITCNANKTIRENIANIFGAKVISQIMPVNLSLSETDTPTIKEISDDCNSDGVKVVGFISKPTWGNGRSSADRQYLYINGRPCNLPKISRALNEIFRTFISNQYPFAILDFRIPNGEFDVNVSPDKRTIFIHNEKWLSQCFSEQLGQMLEPSRYTLPTNASMIVSPGVSETPITKDSDIDTGDSDNLTYNERNDFTADDVIDIAVPARSTRRTGFRLSDMAHTSGTMFKPPNISPEVTVAKRQYSQTTLDNVAIKRARSMIVEEESPEKEEITLDEKSDLSGSDESSDVQELFKERTVYRTNGDIWDNIEDDGSTSVLTDSGIIVDHRATETHDKTYGQEQSITTTRIAPQDITQEINKELEEQHHNVDDILDDLAMSRNVRHEEIITDQDVIVSTDRSYLDTCNQSISVDPDSSSLLRRYRRRSRQRESDTGRQGYQAVGQLMNANIANTTDNGQAAQILDRVIQKSDFQKMQVIGQFNLGFIIAALNQADLFIIDQHASDEKFNFETLQQTTQIRGQKLIHPRPIELTASEEMVAIDNLDILKANGFDIQIDEDAPPTQKMKIISQPVSKNVMFNTKDFEELVFLLSDRPGEMVRCSKARAMFASRACRKSVMIGDNLGKGQMIKIIRNMSTIDQPWNCPHGRPTMRHLFNMPPSTGRKSRGMAVKFPSSYLLA
ncbi:mismatch repair endonuclease PMS2 [Umbelopsis sp. PMI_123]|nr:mismatch repair endonuclease PMS2 [Umbelopsis sp. PMI_123]